MATGPRRASITSSQNIVHRSGRSGSDRTLPPCRGTAVTTKTVIFQPAGKSTGRRSRRRGASTLDSCTWGFDHGSQKDASAPQGAGRKEIGQEGGGAQE